jgi:hypothetical protein
MISRSELYLALGIQTRLLTKLACYLSSTNKNPLPVFQSPPSTTHIGWAEPATDVILLSAAGL